MLLLVFYLMLFVCQLAGIVVSARLHNTGWLTVFIVMFAVEIAAIAAYVLLTRFVRDSDGRSKPEKRAE